MRGFPAKLDTGSDEASDDRIESMASSQFLPERGNEDQYFKHPAQFNILFMNIAAPVLPRSTCHRVHSAEYIYPGSTHLKP